MPDQQARFERQVSDPNRGGHQVWEQRHAGMRLEEFLARRKQRVVQKAFDAGQIDFGIFGIRMVAVNKKSGDAEQDQYEGGLVFFQKELLTCFIEGTHDPRHTSDYLV